MTIHYHEYELDGNTEKIWVNGWGVYHNPDAPAKVVDYEDGTPCMRNWYIEGKLHRDGDEPAATIYNRDGTIHHIAYYKMGLCHRETGPAWIPINVPKARHNQVEEWWINGERFYIEDLADYIKLPKEDKVLLKLMSDNNP